MKTNVADTSLDAYFTIKGNGVELNQCGKIYNFLKAHKKALTRGEISEKTGIRLSAVCGRVNKMIEDKHLKSLPSRKCSITDVLAHPVLVMK